jgi:hypothetical protein
MLTSGLYNRHPEELLVEVQGDERPSHTGVGGRFHSFSTEPPPSAEDLDRAAALSECKDAAEAAAVLGLSVKQARRVLQRFREDGVRGLAKRPHPEDIRRRLTLLVRQGTSVGQEICLDAPNSGELVKLMTELRRVGRQVGAWFRWDGVEEVVLRIERNHAVSAEQPWITRKVRRFRAYVVLKSRLTASGWLEPSEEATPLY